MTIEMYRKYRRILKNIPINGKFVKYDWGDLPNPIYISWMPYSQMFDEFSRELANALNTLTRYTHQLTAWRDLLESEDVQTQFSAAVDFIDPIAVVAINLPYVIRSRFIFAAAHLCHQANHAKQGNTWKDDFPLDSEVWFDSADKYGKEWKQYKKFKNRLEKVSAKDYREGTHDFRHAYNHRFSARIVLGISQIVTRRVDESSGGVTYGFGGIQPITLPRLISLLEKQCQHCYLAFDAFEKLIREQEAAIRTHNSAALEAIK